MPPSILQFRAQIAEPEACPGLKRFAPRRLTRWRVISRAQHPPSPASASGDYHPSRPASSDAKTRKIETRHRLSASSSSFPAVCRAMLHPATRAGLRRTRAFRERASARPYMINTDARPASTPCSSSCATSTAARNARTATRNKPGKPANRQPLRFRLHPPCQ